MLQYTIMSEISLVTFDIDRPFPSIGPGSSIAAMAIEGAAVFEHRDPIEGELFTYSTHLNTIVAGGLSRYLCDRYGRDQPPIDTYVKIPNCHTVVAAAKSWINPTKSDPNIDGINTCGLRLHMDEVNWIDLDEAVELPGGEALGISCSEPSEDGTLLVAHSMLTLEEPGMHISVTGSGGKPYIGLVSTRLQANQSVQPGARLVHLQTRPRQIGTAAWQAYAREEFHLDPQDIKDVQATYDALENA